MDVLYIYLLCISIVTFFVYGMDKWKAKKRQYRIPEKTLLILAVIGGGVGALIGMCFFRHKIKKPKFYLGVPAILLMQILILVFIGIKF